MLLNGVKKYNMKQYTTDQIDLKTSQVTEEILINGAGPFSIQPVVSNLCGSPTYTLEVSNVDDEDSFRPYGASASGKDLTDNIQSDYEKFPWKYIRLSCVNTGPTDSGLVIFHISL